MVGGDGSGSSMVNGAGGTQSAGGGRVTGMVVVRQHYKVLLESVEMEMMLVVVMVESPGKGW